MWQPISRALHRDGPIWGGLSMLPRVDLIRTDEFDYLLMNSPDFISHFIKTNGSWGDTEATLCKYLTQGRANAVVIDAGANIGGFALPIAAHVGRNNGRVYCFEPQRIIFQQLCANVFLNRLENVFAFNVAMGDVPGVLQIPELDFSTSTNAGGLSVDATIRQHIANDAKEGRNLHNAVHGRFGPYTVPQVPLDNFGLFSDVAFVKVDVEGYEFEFFNGAVETLRRNKFPPVVFELWHAPWYAEKGKRTVDFVKSLGYELNEFGNEILAQHPAFDRFLKITPQGEDALLELQLRS